MVTGGVSTDTYKWRYFSGGTTYSDYSDELLGTGLERENVGFLIQQVQKNPYTLQKNEPPHFLDATLCSLVDMPDLSHA